MTVDQFRKLKPEYTNVEGDALWNAMEDYMLRQQAGQEVIKKTVPFFKRYQLRWLFYRKMPNLIWGENNYSSDKRCSKCKKGTGGLKMSFSYMGKFITYCPHCWEELIEEPNTSLKHNLWKKWAKIKSGFWFVLNWLHIVRSGHNNRYDMFGDERKYVKNWSFNMETGEMTKTLKKRKWWEYIFIERSKFNF